MCCTTSTKNRYPKTYNIILALKPNFHHKKRKTLNTSIIPFLYFECTYINTKEVILEYIFPFNIISNIAQSKFSSFYSENVVTCNQNYTRKLTAQLTKFV